MACMCAPSKSTSRSWTCRTWSGGGFDAGELFECLQPRSRGRPTPPARSPRVGIPAVPPSRVGGWRLACRPVIGAARRPDRRIRRDERLLETRPRQARVEPLAQEPTREARDPPIAVRHAHDEREVGAGDQVDREGDRGREHRTTSRRPARPPSAASGARRRCRIDTPRIPLGEQVQRQPDGKDRPEQRMDPDRAHDGIGDPTDEEHDPRAGRPVGRVQPGEPCVPMMLTHRDIVPLAADTSRSRRPVRLRLRR